MHIVMLHLIGDPVTCQQDFCCGSQMWALKWDNLEKVTPNLMRRYSNWKFDGYDTTYKRVV